uniref:Uncharacterized protein n=1 Tax=Capra hircus TaxID=9925 RepID=A0A452GBD3_CAPHI
MVGSELNCSGGFLCGEQGQSFDIHFLIFELFYELYLQYFDLAGFLLLLVCLELFLSDVKSRCSVPLLCGLGIFYLFFKINHVSWD